MYMCKRIKDVIGESRPQYIIISQCHSYVLSFVKEASSIYNKYKFEDTKG
jgi:hypothetical protein